MGTAATADPSWLFSLHMMLCLARKAGEKQEEGGTLGVPVFASQVLDTHVEALLSWEWLHTCLPPGGSERMPDFACHARTASALPNKLSVSSALTFTLPVLFPIPLWEVSSYVGLSSLPGLTYDRAQNI